MLDRVNGSRVFTTPEQIGRVLLLIFLTVSAIRTFSWYFEATLPSTPPNDYVPTYVVPPPPHAVLVALPPERSAAPETALAGIVLTWYDETPSARAE